MLFFLNSASKTINANNGIERSRAVEKVEMNFDDCLELVGEKRLRAIYCSLLEKRFKM